MLLARLRVNSRTELKKQAFQIAPSLLAITPQDGLRGLKCHTEKV